MAVSGEAFINEGGVRSLALNRESMLLYQWGIMKSCSLTGSGQHAGSLPVPSCGAPKGVDPEREVGETSFPDGQAAEDLFALAGITLLVQLGF